MKQRSSEQGGYIIVCVCIMLGVLFSIAAAALDAGNLYLWRMRLEKAARAGVISGLGYRALKGWQDIYGGPPVYTSGGVLVDRLKSHPPPTKINLLLQHVEEVVEQNLLAAGLSASEMPAVSIDLLNDAYKPSEDSIFITVSYRVPTLLVGRLGNIGVPFECEGNDPKRCTVKTSQRAELQPATIAMVLDTSGSMICDNDPTDLDCDCRRTSTCGAGGFKKNIDQLKDAAKKFYTFFNPAKDRIAIVPFNIGATVQVPIVKSGVVTEFGKTQADYNQFIAAIDGLTPVSNTNHCDALIQAGEEINKVPDIATSPPFYVFFTDGAPNAMRAKFTNEVLPVGVSSPAGGWYQYSLEWQDASSVRYRGPGPLVDTGSLFNFQIGSDPVTSAPILAPTVPGTVICGDAQPEPPNFHKALSNTPPAVPGRQKGCLTNLQFRLPGALSGAPAVTGVGFTSLYGLVRRSNIDQLHYFCAIQAADWMRTNQRATLFVVGLGKQAADCGDPAQDTDNHFTRKDNFLHRLAFSQATIQGGLGPYTERASTAWVDATFLPNFDFSRRTINLTPAAPDCDKHSFIRGGFGSSMTFGYNGGRRIRDFEPRTIGQYYGTEKPEDLFNIFTQTAKQILLRLGT